MAGAPSSPLAHGSANESLAVVFRPSKELMNAARPLADRRLSLRVLELITVVPLVLLVAQSFRAAPEEFLDWRILVWAAACGIVDLLPVRGSSDMGFSLSFPIGLAAALIYPPAVVAVIAFLGAADMREFKRELPPLKALYIRGQIAWSVALESQVFHEVASLDSPW